MISIIGPRGCGKTTKLFKAARENNSIVLSTNSRALREKAKSLGYRELEIIGFGDLKNDNFSLGKEIMVDNAEYVLATFLEKFYGLKMKGFTASYENETRN
jgi:predicted AAA+ superfamily ATPase